jgi:hypothetical protein
VFCIALLCARPKHFIPLLQSCTDRDTVPGIETSFLNLSVLSESAVRFTVIDFAFSSFVVYSHSELAPFRRSVLKFKFIQPWELEKLVLRSGAIKWGTALQAGRSCVWFPMWSLRFSIDFVHSAAQRSTEPLTEISTRNSPPRGKGGLCVGLTYLTLSCADFLEIVGTLYS